MFKAICNIIKSSINSITSQQISDSDAPQMQEYEDEVIEHPFGLSFINLSERTQILASHLSF